MVVFDYFEEVLGGIEYLIALGSILRLIRVLDWDDFPNLGRSAVSI
jgi:hypothetical protein